MEIRIEWSYKTAKGTEAFFRSEEFPAAHALLIAEDIQKTGRVKSLEFVDRFDSSWTLKELKAYLKGIETEPHNVNVYFDGGFDKETGRAGLGCVIYYEQSGKAYRLRKNVEVAELSSNNEAEYAALHMSVQELERLEVHHLPVVFRGDSNVVANQMSGEWPVYENDLSRWADRIEQSLNRLGIQAQYELIPRKANAEADRLAAQALRGIEISGTMELEKS
ncbi:ribonuclease H family protein [Planococcus sp. 107-1]|uniref:ribonuclease H family protein n=1 Tax=Planococcus sp. 107-1 TaxID=2908840 RepID=UPI001F323C8B|nr:ribonuclease H family protein [Planococcus sp. 107-1]UJF27751.1 ribonuclease H family protein [Planococcus sp. 107-1]